MLTNSKQRIIIVNVLRILAFAVMAFLLNIATNKYPDFELIGSIFSKYFYILTFLFVLFVIIQNLKYIGYRKYTKNVISMIEILILNIIIWIFLDYVGYDIVIRVYIFALLDMTILLQTKFKATKILALPILLTMFLLVFDLLPNYDKTVKIEQILATQSDYFFVYNSMNQPNLQMTCIADGIPKKLTSSDLNSNIVKINGSLTDCVLDYTNSRVFLVFWDASVVELFARNHIIISDIKNLSDISKSKIDVSVLAGLPSGRLKFDDTCTDCTGILDQNNDVTVNDILDFYKKQIIANTKKYYGDISNESKFIERDLIYYKLIVGKYIIGKKYESQFENFKKYLICADKNPDLKLDSKLLESSPYRGLCQIF